MKTYKIRQMGLRGIGVAIPSLYAEILKLKLGDNVFYEIEKDKLIIKKVK